MLLNSGSVAALDAFHADLKDLDYALNANLVELILSAYVGFRLDEETQNKEILSDLLYGCLKGTNQEFMCDIGYVLHQLNEKQGSVILQQSLDSYYSYKDSIIGH